MNISSQKKQVYIDYILDQFSQGIVERKTILAKMVDKWQIADRSFDRYFAQAHREYTDQRSTINAAKLDSTIQGEIETVSINLLKKNEALEMLSDAAKIFFAKIQSKPDAKDANALNACIDRIAKIEGWDAPIRTENNNISPTLRVEYCD